jgi:predicted RNase H-like HicB family nuclease
MSLYIAKASFDAEAGVWYVEYTDIPGLAADAPTFEDLRHKIKIMGAELLAAHCLEFGCVEIIAGA